MSLARDNAQRRLYDHYSSQSDYEVMENCVYLLKAEEPLTEADYLTAQTADPESVPSTYALYLAAYEPYVKVTLGVPTRRRIVRTTGQKQGSPPLMPAPEDSGRFKFESATISLAQPAQNLDGVSAVWTANATITYYENALPSVYTGYILGLGAYDTEAADAMRTSSSLLSSSTLVETDSTPRLGEALGRQVDFTRVDLGLPQTNGAYSVTSYVPGEFFSADAVAGVDPSPFVPPPPPPPPPP